MSRIYIDGDGCPVIEETCSIAEHFSIPITLVCDSAHAYTYATCEIIVTDTEKDRVDFVILQKVQKDDIVITQDYGLATLALSKGAYVLSQNGMRFDEGNILALLNQRSDAAKQRKKNKRYGHMKKRTAQDDAAFTAALYKLLQEVLE